jgi:hypothetical protein
MSEAIQNSDTPSQCDRLLDYAYGELSGDELEQFKLHLLTCENCKRELAGLERVRSAVKQAMPQVEPPVDKMAQLMLAAAQQKPKRGKVLMFARRMVSHPAYAAAAVFVLVATTVTVNWSKHALQMPPPEPKMVVHEPVAASAPAANPAAKEVAQPAEEANGLPEAKPERTLALDKDKNKEPSIVLKTEPAGAFTVRRAAPAKGGAEYVLQPKLEGYTGGGGAASGVARGAPAGDYKQQTAHHAKAEMVPPAEKPAELEKSPARLDRPVAAKPMPAPAKVAERSRDEADDLVLGQRGKVSGGEAGRGTNEGHTSRAEEPVLAPNQAAGRESSMAPQGQVVTATPAAPPPVAPPPPPAAAPAQPAPTTTALAETRQQKAVDPMALKKQFLALAKSDKCTEAVNLHKQIEGRYSGLLSTTDELEYVRCLRRTGQNQLADVEEKALAVENSKASAPRASKKAKAKKSAPADDASSILSPSF